MLFGDKTVNHPTPKGIAFWLAQQALSFFSELRQHGMLRVWSVVIARWGTYWASRANLFLIWWYSPRVTAETAAERNRICDACDRLEIVAGKKYCGACGCPKWKYSELGIKNDFSGHNCPLGRHPGSVVMPEPVLGNAAITSAAAVAGGGCVGCNGKPKEMVGV